LNIPVFIVHEGNQGYLENSISLCSQYHPVILVGDTTNKYMAENWIACEQIVSEPLEDFERSYIHMSTNSEFFEKICFRRYFYMYQIAKQYNYEKFIHIDSDVMLLNKLPDLLENSSKMAAFFVPKNQKKYQFTASPHVSYWTLAGLGHFIKFILDTYNFNINNLQDKFMYHKQMNMPGGVCDMTLLYLFYLKNQSKILNLFDVHSCYIDYNINQNNSSYKNGKVQEYFYFKVFNRKGNQLWFKTRNGHVECIALHLQGKAKLFSSSIVNGQFARLFFSVSMLKMIRRLREIILCRG